MSEYNEITAVITTEEPAVAATLDELRYLVLQGKAGKAPRVSATTGNWEVYDNDIEDWADTGISASTDITPEQLAEAIEHYFDEHPIDIPTDAVLYTPQSLTDSQKAQARTNVGAGTYSKPSGGIPASDLAAGVIPTVPQMATQANMSDWDSGKTVDAATLKTDFMAAALELDALSVNKADKTEIPTKVSDLTNDSNFQTAAQVQSAIAAIPDELPAVTASDNGKVLGVVNGAWAVKSDEGGSSVTVDSALSTTSTNPVQNKVVKAALDAKADASALAAKQDTLTAGQNVTISGNTISADVDSAEIASNVTDWLDANVNPVGSAVVVDSSLSVSGAAADAKATGNALDKKINLALSEPSDASYQKLVTTNFTGENAAFPILKIESATNSVSFLHSNENLVNSSSREVFSDMVRYYWSNGGLFLPAGTYTIYDSINADVYLKFYIVEYDSKTTIVESSGTVHAYTFTLATDKTICFRVYRANINQSMELGITVGTSAPTTFKANESENVSYTLPQSVDRGYVDFFSKSLIIGNTETPLSDLPDISLFDGVNVFISPVKIGLQYPIGIEEQAKNAIVSIANESGSVVKAICDEGTPISVSVNVSGKASVSAFCVGENMLNPAERYISPANGILRYGYTSGVSLPAGTYTAYLKIAEPVKVDVRVFSDDTVLVSEWTSTQLSFELESDTVIKFHCYRNGISEGQELGLCFGYNAPNSFAAYHSKFSLASLSESTSGEVEMPQFTAFGGVNYIYSPDGIVTIEYRPTVEEFVDETANSQNPVDYFGGEICVFNSGVCIGDSFTEGGMNADQTITAEMKQKVAYPQKLQRITGIPITNKGDSGKSTVQWYDAHQNDDLSGHDFAVIFLGINDVSQGGFGQASQTAMMNIINKLKAENNGIKVFVCTIPKSASYGTSDYDVCSTAIKNTVSGVADTYVLDLNRYSRFGDYTAYAFGHPTALGYYVLAREIKNYVSKIIHDNTLDFQWVQFIGTDYTHNNNP